MVDLLEQDGTPSQLPTLSELEEARADAENARQVTLTWLMASEDAPDLEALLSELVHRPEWHRRARCRGMGTDVFFPTRGQSLDPGKAVCARCEVRRECLSSALDWDRTQGVWGGLSDRGRRVLRRTVA